MKTKYLSFILLLLAFSSCSEKELSPISGSLGKPGIVTDVTVEPLAGGATISYKIPNSEDLLAVKCVYTLSGDRENEVMVSYYENKLLIQGYNDTLEHTATLYAVNRAQELSDPVEVKFYPKESPLSKAIKTATIKADFGGAGFSWRNSDKVPLNVELLGPDSVGQMSTLNILTSDIEKNAYSVRGYAPELSKFSMIISDNFNNYSDTLSAEVIPLFEEKLDKKKMRVMRLDNDASFAEWGCLDANLIDDDVLTFGHTANNTIPAAVTFDLGCSAKLSRFVIHQRFFGDTYYNQGNVKEMEIYTCDHIPSQSGDWSEWTKIRDFEIVKPSGSLGNTVTDLDMEAARNGHECSFDLSQPTMRYVRVLIKSGWLGPSYTSFAEISFYGSVEE